VIGLAEPPSSLLQGAALFLDFDGTLVELADTPDSILVPGGLADLLDRLSARLGGRLALVSGRPIDDLDRHVGGAAIARSGSHGLELRLAGGTGRSTQAPEGLEQAQRSVAEFAASRPGLLAESKPAGVALHYRLAPDLADEVEQFMADLASCTGLGIQHGKMVAELRAAGPDKGGALRELMAEPSFAGARPVFVGDDLTDEHAFAAAAAMGGAGILVGPPRLTAASWRLAGVPEVALWLNRALETLGG
jgi:trehalose 6-phosphate phosphatase